MGTARQSYPGYTILSIYQPPAPPNSSLFQLLDLPHHGSSEQRFLPFFSKTIIKLRARLRALGLTDIGKKAVLQPGSITNLLGSLALLKTVYSALGQVPQLCDVGVRVASMLARESIIYVLERPQNTLICSVRNN